MVNFPPPLKSPTVHLRIEGDVLFSYVKVSCMGRYAKNFVYSNSSADSLVNVGEIVRATLPQRVVWYDESTDIFELNEKKD